MNGEALTVALYRSRATLRHRMGGYLTVVLLARVIKRLGTLEADAVNASVVENLFASDLAFLQDLYGRINAEGHARAAVSCPACHHDFTIDLSGSRLGE